MKARGGSMPLETCTRICQRKSHQRQQELLQQLSFLVLTRCGVQGLVSLWLVPHPSPLFLLHCPPSPGRLPPMFE
ncbi:hypothetical protein DUNSADRAFT_3364 [Dunaliella salina]|uniref:Encoded protein n=1 Tax=Dunaliella salina TaxID=3046 RepID=A0ABQ7GU64_DUNSA|nr:hypothetical protein DUNSADRAFT_3364 [Dunaliella salina]|eukprot:KAF5838114.1 hypothetical protein DUNSADRAFT_3364 [Dunaliella salina]